MTGRLDPVAVHEAAHAVVAALFGLPLVKATMQPAVCKFDWSQTRNSARLEFGWIVSCLSAREAEIILTGDDQPLASAGDEMRVRKLFSKRDMDPDRWTAEGRLLARRLVRYHLPVIERGARVLQAFKVLGASDVQKILGDAGRAVGYQPIKVLALPAMEPEPEVEHGEDLAPAAPRPLFAKGAHVGKGAFGAGTTLFDRVRSSS